MPPFPDISPDHLSAISTQHNLGSDRFIQLPEIGIFNRIFQVGDDYILRIARDHPKSFGVARTESIVVPLARAAGVRTPELFVMDDSCAILPVPYTIYARVEGATLGLLDLEPHETAAAWRAVGHDLALLHCGVERFGVAAELDATWNPDPTPWPEDLAEAGYFTAIEARWFTRWLDALDAAVPDLVVECCRHGDNQATNIIVQPKTLNYEAILDWGSAGWGDPAHDFGGIPLRAVPYVLQGYRNVMPVAGDETAEARILRHNLTLALGNMFRGPQPDLSWAERPLGFLVETMRFLLETGDDRWRALVVT